MKYCGTVCIHHSNRSCRLFDTFFHTLRTDSVFFVALRCWNLHVACFLSGEQTNLQIEKNTLVSFFWRYRDLMLLSAARCRMRKKWWCTGSREEVKRVEIAHWLFDGFSEGTIWSMDSNEPKQISIIVFCHPERCVYCQHTHGRSD